MFPATSSAVSILLNSISPSPTFWKALANNSAASLSPSALMMEACLICSALSTRNLAFSASCWATYTLFKNIVLRYYIILFPVGFIRTFDKYKFFTNQNQILHTCLSSTAWVNSLPKVRCVIAISSKMSPNCSALVTKSDLSSSS